MTSKDRDPDIGEEMLRKLLSTPPPPESQPPQAKHKMYSKKAMRRKKESMRPGAPDELDDDTIEESDPHHRSDATAKPDPDTERLLRESMRPPGIPRTGK